MGVGVRDVRGPTLPHAVTGPTVAWARSEARAERCERTAEGSAVRWPYQLFLAREKQEKGGVTRGVDYSVNAATSPHTCADGEQTELFVSSSYCRCTTLGCGG